MKNHESRPGTMKNHSKTMKKKHEDRPETMKNQPGTMKNLENPLRTMKNPYYLQN